MIPSMIGRQGILGTCPRMLICAREHYGSACLVHWCAQGFQKQDQLFCVGVLHVRVQGSVLCNKLLFSPQSGRNDVLKLADLLEPSLLALGRV